MLGKKKVLAIIPARGGSKGIPRKNLKVLAGRPLMNWTIQASLDSSYIDETVVSTEDGEIGLVALQAGARVVKRPDELAKDSSPTEPSMLHAVQTLEARGERFDIILLLQATSPLRSARHIDRALELYQEKGANSLLSAFPSYAFFWKKGEDERGNSVHDYRKRPRRQDKEPLYQENGAIYITTRNILLKEENRLGGDILVYEMREEDSTEIDTPFEMELCEKRLEARKGHRGKITEDIAS